MPAPADLLGLPHLARIWVGLGVLMPFQVFPISPATLHGFTCPACFLACFW